MKYLFIFLFCLISLNLYSSPNIFNNLEEKISYSEFKYIFINTNITTKRYIIGKITNKKDNIAFVALNVTMGSLCYITCKNYESHYTDNKYYDIKKGRRETIKIFINYDILLNVILFSSRFIKE